MTNDRPNPKTRWCARCMHSECKRAVFVSPKREDVEKLTRDPSAWALQRERNLADECCEQTSEVEIYVCHDCGRFGGKLVPGWKQDPKKPADDCRGCGRPLYLVFAPEKG